jgi:hypothetical protein
MCKQKVGLLADDEKEALEGQQYASKKFFTPEEDADGNFVLPLKQIKNLKNPEFWWVKYLPLIDYKPKQMDKSIIPDIMALSGLFLFTGAEISIENTIFEIISKFGVVAVLWYWLQNMKGQIKEQMTHFSGETELLRKEHKETLTEFQDVHNKHNELIKQQLEAKDQMIKDLQSKIK